MKLTKIEKHEAAVLQHAALAALATVAAEYGVQVKAAGGKHGGKFAVLSFEFSVEGGDAQTRRDEAARAAFTLLAKYYGFGPDDLGRTFTTQGTEYRITGLSAGGKKYPVLAERVRDGKGFKFPADISKLLHTTEPK